MNEISTSVWPDNPLAYLSDTPLPATPLSFTPRPVLPERNDILSAGIAGAGAIIDGLARENARLAAENAALRDGMKGAA